MTAISVGWSVSERLHSLLIAEDAPAARNLGDLQGGVVKLKSELDGILESFLPVAEDRTNDDDVIRKATQQITELAYDIEDAIEAYIRRQEASPKVGKLISLFPHGSPARSLREDLKSFRRRIDELRDLIQSDVGTLKLGIGSASIRSGMITQHDQLEKEVAVNHASDVVGMREYEERLMSLLLGGPSSRSVIAIWGMGGIGKTTLARLLYDDPSVVQRFDIRVWATVGMGFRDLDILKSLLLSLSPLRSDGKMGEIAGMETMRSMEKVHKALIGRRYLLVLDDVWSTEAWQTIRVALPDNNCGSRIVITTRKMDVARDMGASVLEMHQLDEDSSWELLKMRCGLWDDPSRPVNPKIEDIGRQLVEYCRGVPLAITIIGGSMKGRTFEDWNFMLRRAQSYQIPGGLGAHDILALSYNDLPIHLKPCFLYLGLFPPHQVITLDKVCLLWIAEGLLSMVAGHNKTQMELAADYLSEFVNRSLVIGVEKQEVSAFGKFGSYRIHDLMRDLCIHLGEKEEFLGVIGRGREISSSTRRIAIYRDNIENTNVHLNMHHDWGKHMRSILFFDSDEHLPEVTWPREVADLKDFQATRILDFNGVDFRVKNLRGVEKLIYLRHLSFRGCHLQELPSSVSDFPFLETLDLLVRDSCIMTIPNVLCKLLRLRHLYFPSAFRTDTQEKLKLDTLKKLQVLENFHAGVCDAEDLLQLKNLQILTGTVDGNNKDLQNTIKAMEQITSFSHSVLAVKNFDSRSKERLSVVAALLECDTLHALDLEGYLGVFPRNKGAFGSRFTRMVFNGSEFREDPMPILGQFPNLRILVLCNDAFVGTEMVCSEPGGFPRLRSLKLATLRYLEKWEVDADAMPILTTLTVEHCHKLEMLPRGLGDIITLEKLMIGSMPKGFQVKVNEFIEEQKKLGNDELRVTYHDC